MADNNNMKQRTTSDEVRERFQLEKNKTEFSNKMDDIFKIIIDMRQKSGDQDINENTLYRVMCSYYEMGLKMQEAIEAMTAIQTALQCVTSAIGVMDDMISFFNNSMMNIYQNDQGFFARSRAKRQVKKAQKSIARRLNVVTSYMTGMSGMADAITKSMDGVFRKMDNRAGKSKKKQSRKSSSGGSGNAAANNFPRTEKLIDDYMKANGITPNAGSGASGGSAASGSGWDAN